MKKILAMLFACAIVFSLTMPVFAQDAGSSGQMTTEKKTKKAKSTKAKKSKKTTTTQ